MAFDTMYRVAVLMGGFGGEREVSLKSGRAVLQGLREAGHEAIPYDVTDPALPGLEDMLPDAAFVALHGAYGEDGGVQQVLDGMGIPYTGSDAEASRLGMDKLASKRLFVRHSVPTADYFVVGPRDDLRTAAGNAQAFGYPFVCKPVCSGSSLGISIVRSPRQLRAALSAARAEGDSVLVERYVRGREFTVGVLDGEALPMVELMVGREFFDYEAKYRGRLDRLRHPRRPAAHALPPCHRRRPARLPRPGLPTHGARGPALRIRQRPLRAGGQHHTRLHAPQPAADGGGGGRHPVCSGLRPGPPCRNPRCRPPAQPPERLSPTRDPRHGQETAQ